MKENENLKEILDKKASDIILLQNKLCDVENQMAFILKNTVNDLYKQKLPNPHNNTNMYENDSSKKIMRIIKNKQSSMSYDQGQHFFSKMLANNNNNNNNNRNENNSNIKSRKFKTSYKTNKIDIDSINKERYIEQLEHLETEDVYNRSASRTIQDNSRVCSNLMKKLNEAAVDNGVFNSGANYKTSRSKTLINFEGNPSVAVVEKSNNIFPIYKPKEKSGLWTVLSKIIK